MPSKTLYTPIPSGEAIRPVVFEYIAFVRIQVESSYMGLNGNLDPKVERAAIMSKPVWFRGEWNPGHVSNNRDLSYVALQKLAAYLALGAKNKADTSVEFAAALAALYPGAYAKLAGSDEERQKLAVFRIETGRTDDAGDYFGYRIISEGEMPIVDAAPPGKMDDITVFIRSAAKLDILRKLELLRPSAR